MSVGRTWPRQDAEKFLRGRLALILSSIDRYIQNEVFQCKEKGKLSDNLNEKNKENERKSVHTEMGEWDGLYSTPNCQKSAWDALEMLQMSAETPLKQFDGQKGPRRHDFKVNGAIR